MNDTQINSIVLRLSNLLKDSENLSSIHQEIAYDIKKISKGYLDYNFDSFDLTKPDLRYAILENICYEMKKNKDNCMILYDKLNDYLKMFMH